MLIAAGVGAGDVVGYAGLPLLTGSGDHRADHRVVVDEADRRARIAAGQEAFVAAAVVGELVSDGADEGELVGDAGVQGQQFAHVEAGNVRADRPERAAVLRRGVRLHVVGLHVRRPTRQPDEDDGGVGRLTRLRRLQTQGQQSAHTHTAQGERTHLEEAAPGKRAGAVENSRTHEESRQEGRWREGEVQSTPKLRGCLGRVNFLCEAKRSYRAATVRERGFLRSLTVAARLGPLGEPSAHIRSVRLLDARKSCGRRVPACHRADGP